MHKIQKLRIVYIERQTNKIKKIEHTSQFIVELSEYDDKPQIIHYNQIISTNILIKSIQQTLIIKENFH